MSLSREYTPEELKDLENKSIKLHSALYDKKKTVEIIVDILSTTTNEERQIIRGKYKKFYLKPIQNDIKTKLNENLYLLRDLAINMFDTPYEYDARELNKLFSSTIGGEDDIIIEIFATRPKAYLNVVDIAYNKFFGITLRQEIKEQLPKEFAQYLLSIMDTERALEQSISVEEAYKIAKDIKKNGFKNYGIDINLFKNTFVEKSREDLIIISRAYNELEQKNLYDYFEEEDIIPKSLFDEKEEEKKIRNKNIKLIKALIFGVITPAQFFAKKCVGVLSGFKTDINTIFRVLINRNEIDMDAIRDYYNKETNSDITQDIENEYTCRTNEEIGKIMSNLSIRI